MRTILGAATLGTMLLVGVVAWFVIRRSLRPVDLLSRRITAIDAASLGERLDLDRLPEELRPPFAKVNELLARVEQVLGRERQFSADVSHELRTPLAGLRTILEVSGSRERSASEHRANVLDALAVVRQLEAIVENLLAIARLRAGHLDGTRAEEVDVAALVDACFAPLSDTAERRRLRFENCIAPGTTALADPLKLRLIASNLLSNASQYTDEGGWITAESAPAEGVVVRIRDSGPAIPEGALQRVFDPFFRVDRSRSATGEHCGIGLSLVRGLCDACGYRVTAENEPGGAVAFTVATRPAPRAHSPATAASGSG
jgi:signal transduction histidine kinase